MFFHTNTPTHTHGQCTLSHACIHWWHRWPVGGSVVISNRNGGKTVAAVVQHASNKSIFSLSLQRAARTIRYCGFEIIIILLTISLVFCARARSLTKHMDQLTASVRMKNCLNRNDFSCTKWTERAQGAPRIAGCRMRVCIWAEWEKKKRMKRSLGHRSLGHRSCQRWLSALSCGLRNTRQTFEILRQPLKSRVLNSRRSRIRSPRSDVLFLLFFLSFFALVAYKTTRINQLAVAIRN